MAALPGGMRSLSWTQAIQYFVIVLACLVPAAFLASGEPARRKAPSPTQFGALLVGSLPAWSEGERRRLGASVPARGARRGVAAASHRPRARRALRARGGDLDDLGGALRRRAGARRPRARRASRRGGRRRTRSRASGLRAARGALRTRFRPCSPGCFSPACSPRSSRSARRRSSPPRAALSHDVWDEIIDRKGPEGRRIMIARLILIARRRPARVAARAALAGGCRGARALGAGACRGRRLRAARPRPLVAALQRDRRDRRHGRGLRLHRASSSCSGSTSSPTRW